MGGITAGALIGIFSALTLEGAVFAFPSLESTAIEETVGISPASESAGIEEAAMFAIKGALV